MIEPGIFAKTFQRSSLNEVLKAVVDNGLRCVQFNMECTGLPSLPDTIEYETCRAIAKAMKESGITMAAISGTFNTIHPDPVIREEGIARVCQLIAKCHLLGTNIVTLCTGTRDTEDMWKYHTDNETPEAWADLVATLSKLCVVAEKHRVTLAIEPEVVNVINSAYKALKIIEDVGSDYLKVVIDPANLLKCGNVSNMVSIMEEAITLLAPYIVLAHAKDINTVNPEIRVAAGKGCLNYEIYLHLLRKIGYSGALILHGLNEEEVPGSVKFLRKYLEV